MILGLDISTSVVGYSVVDCHGDVIRYGAWPMKPKDFPNNNIFRKVDFIKDKLLTIKANGTPITKICIEAPFEFFGGTGKKKRSSAHTMARLLKYNAMVSYVARNTFGLEPEYLSPASARKICSLKITRSRDKRATKNTVLEHVCKNYKDLNVEYTRFDNPKTIYYDMADAIIVAMAAYKKDLDASK